MRNWKCAAFPGRVSMQAEAIVERYEQRLLIKQGELAGATTKSRVEQALNSIARRLAALEEKSIRYDKEEEILDCALRKSMISLMGFLPKDTLSMKRFYGLEIIMNQLKNRIPLKRR